MENATKVTQKKKKKKFQNMALTCWENVKKLLIHTVSENFALNIWDYYER